MNGTNAYVCHARPSMKPRRHTVLEQLREKILKLLLFSWSKLEKQQNIFKRARMCSVCGMVCWYVVDLKRAKITTISLLHI